MQSLVEIYSAGDAIEANAVCDALAEAGIESQIIGENLHNALGDIPFTIAGPRVWTMEGDATRARIVIQEWSREHWPDGTSAKREPSQFSLKSMFIVVTVVALFAPLLPLIYGWDFGNLGDRCSSTVFLYCS
jgi:hypothetical protein